MRNRQALRDRRLREEGSRLDKIAQNINSAFDRRFFEKPIETGARIAKDRPQIVAQAQAKIASEPYWAGGGSGRNRTKPNKKHTKRGQWGWKKK